MPEVPGVIGLGDIGRQIAGHWIDDGYDVHVYDLDREKVETLAEAGATATESSRDLAEKCDVILILAGTGDQVESVLFDDGGVVEGASAGDVVVVSSTVHPLRYREWVDRFPDDVVPVDAPLTLGVFLDERGAVVFAGGSDDAVDRLMPFFESYSKAQFHVGGPSAGQMTKTANNLLLWACYVADYEALRLATEFGADTETVREAITHGSGNNYALDVWKEAWDRGGGRWAEDDLRIAFELAEELGLELPQTERTQDAMAEMTLGDIVSLTPTDYGGAE